jgi:fatty-acyl-CoA synthase
LQYATARMGSIMVTLNPAYRAPELAHALELSGCKAMVMVPSVAQSNYVDMLNSGAALDPARLPLLKHVIVAGSGAAGEGGGREGAGERSGSGAEIDECAVRAAVASLAAGAGASSQHRFHAYADVFENAAHASSSASSATSLADNDLAPTDPINIQFTSGTTGLPKAVLLTHLNVANNGTFVAERQRLTAEDRVCIPVPM